MTTGVTVVILPRATADRPLPVGQLCGPYLAADIAARAARERGEQVVTTAGVDVHRDSVLACAEDEGVEAEKLAAARRDELLDVLEAARIQHDVFLDPLDQAYLRGVTTLAADLTEAGRVPLRRRTPFRAKVPVLSMEDYRQELTEIWLRAELSHSARQLVTHHLERRLPDVPIAYPANWGLEGTGPHEGLRLAADVELALSTAYGVAQAIRPGASGLEETAQAWSEISSAWHFDGIGNGFLVTLFWPAIYLACGVPPESIGGAHLNEPSPDQPIVLHGEDADILRRYAAWRWPAGFTLSTYQDFKAQVPGGPSDPVRAATALRPQSFNPALAHQLLSG
ncbi:class I tRNA ligase family protein [Kribbella sp. NPDC002412]